MSAAVTLTVEQVEWLRFHAEGEAPHWRWFRDGGGFTCTRDQADVVTARKRAGHGMISKVITGEGYREIDDLLKTTGNGWTVTSRGRRLLEAADKRARG